VVSDMSAAVQIVLVPVPVAASWLDRYNQASPRKSKTPPGWPVGRQPIPDRRAVRDLVERAQRTLADERERRALRELRP
jgi:hypothetical protein